jgi:hypothetical protein
LLRPSTVLRLMQQVSPIRRIGKEALVFLTGLVEFLMYDLVGKAFQERPHKKNIWKNRYTLRGDSIFNAIRVDAEIGAVSRLQ